jgi:hypothetical protein
MKLACGRPKFVDLYVLPFANSRLITSEAISDIAHRTAVLGNGFQADAVWLVFTTFDYYWHLIILHLKLNRGPRCIATVQCKLARS